MPRFTVAIPTFNRAHYLPETLACLARQTYHDFEIVISDNASTDNTEEVVSQLKDSRIRYYRQPALLCVGDNFGACADLAQTDWIIFHQDDDLLNPCFLERCARAVDAHPDVVMYAADCIISKDVSRANQGSLCGFPFRHCWSEPQPRLIPGVQIAALGWFVNCFFPPAQAMPTRLCRKHWPRGPEAVYLGDHYFTSHVACEGVVAYESYTGAIIREHQNRVSNTTPDIAQRRVETPFIELRALFEKLGIDWETPLREIITEAPVSYREWLLNEYLFNQYVAPQALEILGTSIAVDKGISPLNYVESLRTERLTPPPRGRLDRWNVPKPVARAIRGLLYAVGKDYREIPTA